MYPQKGEYQLYFKVVNNVVLPMFEKRTVVSASDLFRIEALSKVEDISLSAVMQNHMYKIINVKYGKHGMGLGYLLMRVFKYFTTRLDKWIKRTIKQAI